VSVQALTWAWEQDVAAADDQLASPASAKFVLVAVANFANEEWRAYPSVGRVCRMTGLAERTVRACLKALEAQKLIEQVGSTGRTNRVAVFQLMRQMPPDSNPADHDANPADYGGESGRLRTTPNEEPSLNRQGTGARAREERRAAPPADVVDRFRKLRSKGVVPDDVSTHSTSSVVQKGDRRVPAAKGRGGTGKRRSPPRSSSSDRRTA
jgi:hypothetical protein